MTRSRGRCSGNGLRDGRLRVKARTGASSRGGRLLGRTAHPRSPRPRAPRAAAPSGRAGAPCAPSAGRRCSRLQLLDRAASDARSAPGRRHRLALGAAPAPARPRAPAAAASALSTSSGSASIGAHRSQEESQSAALVNQQSAHSIHIRRSSARRLRPPGVLRHAPVDAFQQITQLRRRDRHHAVRPVTARRSGRAPAAWRTATCPARRARAS